MLLKFVSLAALLGITGAQQTQNLTATLAGNANLSNLTTFLGQFPDLLNSLAGASNITVLAPSNEAFSQLLNSSTGAALATNPGLIQAVLQYHVLNGTYSSKSITNTTAFVPTLLTNSSYTNVTGGQRVEAVGSGGGVAFFSGLLQNSTVTQADVNFTGGTIHIINSVLTLPASISSTAAAANLTSLYGALNSTKLIPTVNSLHDVTVFAPLNSAFQSIGSALASLSTDDLTSILTYHVVNGTVGYSTGLKNGTTLKTVNGKDLTVRIENGTVFVNSAKVVVPNVLVANGVVHVIDNVLNPNATSAAPSASATIGAPAFSGASSVSDTPFTSGVPTPTTTVATTAAPPAGGATSSTRSGAAVPMMTGAVGPAMLFGAGVVVMNL